MKAKFNGILTLLLALTVQFVFAQKTVSGTVTGETGPLPGVNIVIKGTTTGAETDFDGKYSIQAKQGDILVFSYVGMESQEVTVGASNTMNVVLKSSNVLDEVVVMGFASRKKSELTGSSVQIDEDQITQVPVVSVDQVLQGKVAGLSISGTSGTPGSTQDIRIRGVSSINASNEPLYVIDGVPVVSGNFSGTTAGSSFSALASLNPNNIESITVLKDPSATAPYGARGANGVIVITTKSGKFGKTKFNLMSSIGFSNDAVKGPQMLTAAQQQELYYEAVINTFGAAYGVTKDNVADFALHALGDPEFSNWEAAGSPETNWGDIITNKNAIQHEISFSATGGDETSNYLMFIGHNYSDATVIGSNFKRYSGGLNFSKDLTKSLKLTTINNASHSVQDGLLEQSAYYSSPRMARFFMSPYKSPYNEDGSYNFDLGSAHNPLYISENNINLNKLTRLTSNNSVEWKTPVENLSFSTKVAMDLLLTDYKEYQNRIHGDGASTSGYAYRQNFNDINMVFQNRLNYKWWLNDLNKFDFILQQEYQTNKTNYVGTEGEEFAADGLSNLNSAGKPTGTYSSFEDWYLSSYTGMLNYSFSNKYVVNTSYRIEGNSRFAPKKRWGDFWSVGAAWNISNENILKNSVFNNLKLRASYGVTGNAGIGLNLYQDKLGFDANYNDEAAIYPAVYGNEDLTWETQSTLDTGLDFGLWKDRLSGSVTYFYRISDDMLLSVPLSETTGFSSQMANIGTMWNKGWEFELNGDIVRTENVNFSLGGYVSTVENKVTALALDNEGNPRTSTSHIQKIDVDHMVNEYYLVKFAGVDPQTGVNLYYLNADSDATTTNFALAQRQFTGKSALPTLTAGMNMHFDYKNFFIDAQGYYAGGHQVYEGWHRYVHGSDLYNTLVFNSVNTLMDRWQQPGDITNVEKVTYSVKPWQRHTNYLHDGDYFRLKNVTVGYDLKGDYFKEVGLENIKIFVRGVNLYTWVKDKNLSYDPEVNATGETGLTTPAVKTIMGGININF